ncbi:serine hydrolase domain-containing protein [Saccharicrinis sp. FJH54]|uniref:serine hydrolase domain-containing protein n=1 Tax=Saccharicrinis sp. FJH54 TaxID=3344665 RepID=UPI0035D43DDC
MKLILILPLIALVMNSCGKEPADWSGPVLSQPRLQLTVDHLLKAQTFPLTDMSFFTMPEWAQPAVESFSGSVSFSDSEITYPIERAYYPGENIFPGITLDFISHDEELIPVRQIYMVNGQSTKSGWNVIVGTGKVWHENVDGEWSRASFPLSLTDSHIGQIRNCVATFVYKQDSISRVYIQSSQETADLNDHQVGNMRVVLKATYRPKTYTDSLAVIEERNRIKADRLPVYPLSVIDTHHDLAGYFDKKRTTNAPTSLGAVIMDKKVYLQPPKTRHGLYPYPCEMRHAVYSVTKSMAGALALFYFAQRYGEELFDALITDYVPVLRNLPEWQNVTFSQTLNMVTGTEGGEDAARLYEILVKPLTAEEAINNIAGLGDKEGSPGEHFSYASTNLFVLSYALQNYVEQKEGSGVRYWDLVHENVLVPLGAEDFIVLHTIESDNSDGLPILAYGAWPTLDNAAKIALLFSEEGYYNGQQLLSREKCREAMGRTAWKGYSTGNDYRGKYYRHSFWATDVSANGCDVDVTYMLGYGGNYVWFFPSGVIALRFMDEYDLEFKDLVKAVERIRSSCQ